MSIEYARDFLDHAYHSDHMLFIVNHVMFLGWWSYVTPRSRSWSALCSGQY